jgi:hypothetical protein
MRIRSPWLVAYHAAWGGLVFFVALLIIDAWW